MVVVVLVVHQSLDQGAPVDAAGDQLVLWPLGVLNVVRERGRGGDLLSKRRAGCSARRWRGVGALQRVFLRLRKSSERVRRPWSCCCHTARCAPATG